ncbi:MAG: PilZ domain-containing protein [Deltaproteobacteria bacterium]|nr:PilZ domain-containing protein [Deltaproteobacteria bacterium]
MSLEQTGAHQRQESREEVNHICNYTTKQVSTPGNLIDITPTGAGMECSVPFHPGESGDLEVTVMHLRVLAEVKWCLPFRDKYRVGLAFLHVYED